VINTEVTDWLKLAAAFAALLIIVFYIGYSFSEDTPLPTPTPLTPSRTVEDAHNLEWHKCWRSTENLYSAFDNIRNLIAVKDGVILPGEPKGEQLRYISTTGNLQWSVDLKTTTMYIAADENLVYVTGLPRRTIKAYNIQTGKLAWEFPHVLPDHRGYRPRLQENDLYVYDTINSVYVVDKNTGKLTRKVQFPKVGQQSFPLLMLNEDRWLLRNETKIMLLENQAVAWETTLFGIPQIFPEIYKDILIVRTNNPKFTLFGGLAAVELKTGKLIWQRNSEFYSNFIIHDDMIYVISKEAAILILDPTTGQTIGYAKLVPSYIDITYPIGAIAAYDDMLYVYFYDSRELTAFGRNGCVNVK
jgi:outer membrane protein assembly factor BamB